MFHSTLHLVLHPASRMPTRFSACPQEALGSARGLQSRLPFHPLHTQLEVLGKTDATMTSQTSPP